MNVRLWLQNIAHTRGTHQELGDDPTDLGRTILTQITSLIYNLPSNYRDQLGQV